MNMLKNRMIKAFLLDGGYGTAQEIAKMLIMK
jgi:predicted Rossmann-fold nucleotide-binding protein